MKKDYLIVNKVCIREKKIKIVKEWCSSFCTFLHYIVTDYNKYMIFAKRVNKNKPTTYS